MKSTEYQNFTKVKVGDFNLINFLEDSNTINTMASFLFWHSFYFYLRDLLIKTMKKNFILLLTLFSAFILAQGIKFEQDSFSNILSKAKKENKLVFLDAYATWCGPCKMLEKNVFSQKEVGDFYNLKFVNAHFDMEKGEGISIAKKYAINSYPALLFINGDGDVVYKTAGFMSVPEFIELGKNAANPDNNVKNKISKFNAGENNPEFLLDLIKNIYSTDFNFAKKVSERYFLNKKPSDLAKEDIGLLLYFTKSSEDANYQYLNNNKAEILKFIPENVFNDFQKQMNFTTVFKNAVNENAQTIDENLLNTELIKILGEKEGRLLSSKIRADFYFRNKNFIGYQKAAIEYYQDPEKYDAVELNDAAWNFYLYIDDKVALQNAANWCLAAIKKQEESSNTDTLAKIYYKMGDMKNAKFWAEKSIKIAKSINAEYTSTEELLNKIK